MKKYFSCKKNTRKILCYSLTSKFKHIFIEYFSIGCKKKKKNLKERERDVKREDKWEIKKEQKYELINF